MQPLNPDTVATFGDFMQPQELRDFLRRVQLELGSHWPELEARWRARDWGALQKGAHRLKSVVGSVGCETLYHGLNQLESRLRAQPLSPPGDAELAQLQAAVAEANQALLAAVAAPWPVQPSGTNT